MESPSPTCVAHAAVAERGLRRRDYVSRSRPGRGSGGVGAVLALLVLCFAAIAAAVPQATYAGGTEIRFEPTSIEQLLIYELNRARSNPVGYAREQGLGDILDEAPALPPLAVNDWLTASARQHAEEMAEHDYFDHRSAITGRSPNAKARDAGYPLPQSWPDGGNYIESLAAGYPSAAEALRALIEDVGFNPPGHRYHLLALGPDRDFWMSHREVGAGYAFEAETTYGDYYVLQTAREDSSWPFVTGIVYEDRSGSGRYDLNEGLGGVEVVAYAGDGVAAEVTTNQAGGFSMALLPGVYTIRVRGGDFLGEVEVDVTLGGENIHLAIQSAPGEPEFAVEQDFEFQVFEPLQRDEESTVRQRELASGDPLQRDNATSQSGSNSNNNSSGGFTGFGTARGCSVGAGPAGSEGESTLPLAGIAVLFLLGMFVMRRKAA